MKHDFKKMEDEMDKLAANMSTITEFSEKITGTLQGKRQQITKLSGVHTLLKKVRNTSPSIKLQILFSCHRTFFYTSSGEKLLNCQENLT